VLNLLEWIVLMTAVRGSLSWGISSSVAAAKPTAGNSWAGNSSDGLPQQLDRAEDRGDHHDHRAGDAPCQNVI
jgi:hypothetical protein